MELRQLAVVVAVAEEGGFTAAAQRLRTVQSTVSTVVRALERDLGTPLFHRTTHRVVLTPAGEAFVPAARAALRAAERARAAVSPVSGTVRWGVCPGLLADVPRVLAGLRQAHPGVAVEVRQLGCGCRESDVDVVLTSADQAVALAFGGTSEDAAAGDLPDIEGAVARPPSGLPLSPDAAVTPRPPSDLPPSPDTVVTSRPPSDSPRSPGAAVTPRPPSGLPASSGAAVTPRPPSGLPLSPDAVVSPLPPEELVLAAPGGAPSGPAELSSLPLVGFPPGWAIRQAVDRTFPGRRVTFEVDDLAVAAGLVEAGLGACVLPASAAARFPGLAVRRFERPPPWQLAAVHRGDVTPAVAALLGQLG
ncbi:LysR family transcriptional regulator [Amycolatopsis sp. NPDC049688]|uniref:LysR family transcriptional regulator n=1 Tax=Amycolatopsis sp. NPDC049688 TaxID=3154733 RepID=UPI003413E671